MTYLKYTMCLMFMPSDERDEVKSLVVPPLEPHASMKSNCADGVQGTRTQEHAEAHIDLMSCDGDEGAL